MASRGRNSSGKSSTNTSGENKKPARTTKSTGRSGSRSSASTKKASSSGSRSGNTTSAAKSNQLRDEVVVLVAFAFSLILILSNFNLAGSVGEKIKWLMFGLFGVTEYIFPFVLAGTLLFLIANRGILSVARIKTVAVYVLMMLLGAVWQRIGNNPDINKSSFGRFFTYCADNKDGGGFFGGSICKLLSSLGLWGSLVVMIILIIIALIIITEKSFINGMLNMKDSGSKMVHAAKQDYDMYREHSAERMNDNNDLEEESEEEYLKRRRQDKEQKRLEKLKKKQEKDIQKRADRKARGVTNDTMLPRDASEYEDSNIDIHEITVDTSRHDQFSDDIYDPTQQHTPEIDSVSRILEDDNIYDGMEEVIDNQEYTFVNNNEDVNYDNYESYVDEQPTQAVEHTEPEPIAEPVMEEKHIQDVEDVINKEQEPVQDTASVIHEEKKHNKKYVFPPLSLLKKNPNAHKDNMDRENHATAMRLQQTLQNFGVKVTITDISCGPAVTRYELQPEQGVKVSKIVSLSDDIKLNLAAADIRIEAPIPGKAAIGIEVPNKEAGSVMLRELLETDTFKNHSSPIAFAAGKDIAGKTIVADIAKMPHLLIAGATGSGKSVCINTIIMSIIYKADPEDVKLIMVDPKVVELSVYNGIPHLMIPVVTDPKKASGALNWAVAEMTDRYKKFAQMNVRDLKGFNAKIEKMDIREGEPAPEKMPQIVIIIDELADLMMVAPGEVEDAICRLAQLARAAGIHLVIATQRPSVNVITGLIKANVPSRIAFSVSSGVDSRTIIDMNGAEKLLGKGDMLFFPSGYPKPVRVQGAFVSDEEVGKVVEFLKEHAESEPKYNEEITQTITSTQSNVMKEEQDERDPYFAEAGRFVIGKEKGSIGMLQRYYKIGFNRAGRIMDQLADAGVVGPELGTKPRKVEMTLEEFEEYLRANSIN